MPTDRAQERPKINKPVTVQMERLNRRSSSRCEASHPRIVIDPLEMLVPAATARMKESDKGAIVRIGAPLQAILRELPS